MKRYFIIDDCYVYPVCQPYSVFEIKAQTGDSRLHSVRIYYKSANKWLPTPQACPGIT